ncbi:ribosomal peptide maturation radical SAM protein 1 [Sinorhizobium kostiense]|uniref:Ribosomal peptide maturation radical SAM protein 1 n=2 Tax=Sinorhizobium kostiense TaxID=76747 RepID=A0ABS4R091_9HYPH|nr:MULTISPECIES: RiPP maturation radical SAM C-methyltransferase [Sinorhizobium]MBP2236305.1 ribosomal peptide maturation radical SAM protein 1 [Sinorhizobium kostiense]PST20699.1 RiPP maturation radical SAM protein 1 [Mesorhizobium plurifarium]
MRHEDQASTYIYQQPRSQRGDVILLSMPMASLNHPTIGLSLLKSALRRNGYHAAIRHFFLDFAEYVGPAAYCDINDDRYFLALVGEWLFSAAAHGDVSTDDIGYISRILCGEYRHLVDARKVLNILESRKKISGFLDHCMAAIDWEAYAVVGFSSSFQQTMASLALAKRIKERYPNKFIVFGGANCEDEMGTELHRLYPVIDAVVGGEAEITFPELVKRYLNRENLAGLPGVTVRDSEKAIHAQGPSLPIVDLDDLPFVDYDDFYADRHRAPNVSKSFDAVPLFESARGCWWGQKHHCTFCGLNALGMTYRSKSQERAYSELLGIANRYGREILVVDNILNTKYFNHFLPRLARTLPPLLMHYEVKANLRASQLSVLARAGVRKIQPGIESFSTNVLRLMRKGTTMLRNVQTLKLAAEAGIYVEWGHLYGFPGETIDDYRCVLGLIPFLTHLSPPSGVTRVRADRFSPYFNEPSAFNISIRPLPAYAHIYSSVGSSIQKLAYHFDIEKPDDHHFEPIHQELHTALERWDAHAATSALSLRENNDGEAVVRDCRVGTGNNLLRLTRPATRALAFAAEIQGVQGIRDKLGREFGASVASETIEELLSLHLLLREGQDVLSLALRQPGFERAPLKTEIRDSLEHSYFHRSSAFLPHDGGEHETVDYTIIHGC